MLVNFGFASAVVLAALGIAAGVAIGHRGPDASGTVRIVPATESTPSFAAAANQRAASHSGPRRDRHLSRTRGPL